MKPKIIFQDDISYINVSSNSFDFTKIENNIKIYKPSISTHSSSNSITSKYKYIINFKLKIFNK